MSEKVQESEVMAPSGKGWFEDTYAKTADVLEKAKLQLQKGQRRKDVRMQFEIAYNNAEKSKIDKKIALQDSQSFGKFDVNVMFDLEMDIEMLSKQQEWLKKHYKLALGKDMKVNTEDDD
jgi:hypothetical protein